MSHVVPLTDRVGKPLLGRVGLREPLPGSVVLTGGPHGTAWQRFFADDLWYPVRSRGGKGKTWGWLLSKRNLVLVYDAEERLSDRLIGATHADAALRKEGA